MGYNLEVNTHNLPDNIEDLEQNKKLTLFKNIFEVIEGYFDDKISNLYGIWLTSERCVKKIYCDVSNNQETSLILTISNLSLSYDSSELFGGSGPVSVSGHGVTKLNMRKNFVIRLFLI